MPRDERVPCCNTPALARDDREIARHAGGNPRLWKNDREVREHAYTIKITLFCEEVPC